MTKLTKLQIEAIRRKFKAGKSYKRIAKDYGVRWQSIYYWCSKKYRDRNLERSRKNNRIAWKKKKTLFHRDREKYRAYQREYHNKKYAEDERFRKKSLIGTIRWQKENHGYYFAYKRKKYDSRKKQGICVSCERKAEKGKALCRFHRESNERSRKRRIAERKEQGLCPRCGMKPLNPEKNVLCEKCLERSRKYNRKYCMEKKKEMLK